MASTPRSYTSGHFFFNLDGVKAGFLESAAGGDAVADVVAEPAKPGTLGKKHIANVRYEEIRIALGLDLDAALYEWIQASWAMSYARKDGSIVTGDATFQAKTELEFFQALVTETTFPALDAGSKDAGHMTVKLAPEYTRARKASGKLTPPAARVQKKWLPANFRFELSGLDCSKVSRIDSFTIKQTAATDDLGERRDVLKEPAGVEFPNLRVTLAEVSAQTWHEWHEDFVIKGNCGDDQEKEGAIVLLAPDLKAELARITLHHVGIFALRRVPQTTTQQVPRLVADLYCEQMVLHVGPPAVRPAIRPRAVLA